MCSFVALCAARLPPYLESPDAASHPDCPPAANLSAVGTSPDGPEAAQAAARAAVVRQLSSSIRVEVDRVLRIGRTDGQISAERHLTERVSERSEFSHGEMIRPVGKVVKNDKRYWALACLDRGLAATAIRRDLAEPMSRFEAEAALDPTVAESRSAFAARYRRARESLPAVLSGLAALRAVLGGRTELEERVQSLREALVREASRIRGSMRLGLWVESNGIPGDIVRSARDAFRDAITRAGLDASTEASECGPDLSYLIVVQPDPRCGWGSLGHTCKPRFGLRGTECATGRRVFDAEVVDGGLHGADGRDSDRALQKALRGLDGPRLLPHVQRALGAEIPLEE